ncbi:MAG: hypothetical protein IPK68_00130 [Bdellovibrionales bacterium]|nr:hypothetical protein [Bdellovibrionales bacterium]
MMSGRFAKVSFLKMVYVTLIFAMIFGHAPESGARESISQRTLDSSGPNAKLTTGISERDLTSGFLTEPADLPDIELENGEQVRLRLKSQIELLLSPPDLSLSPEYLNLDPNLKQKFNTKRLGILRALAAILSKGRFVFGLHGFVKGKYHQIRNRDESGNATDELGDIFPPNQKRSLAEHGLNMVRDIVGAVDKFLFSQARLLIDSNEVGFVMGLAPILETGAAKWGYGGVPLSVYLSVGYNSQENSYVVDIARGSESFENAMSAFVIGGLNIQTGVYLLSSKSERDHQVRSGTTFYPPVAPMYVKVTKSGDYASLGMSTTFPPFGGDLFTWTNKQSQVSVLRVKISKHIPGFVRWTWGGMPNLGIIWQKVGNAVAELKSRSQIKDRLKNSSLSSSGLCRQAVVGGAFADIQ